MRSIIFLAPLALAACNSSNAPDASTATPDATPSVAAPAASTVEATPAAVAASDSYNCDNGKTVLAAYDNSDPNMSKVTLTIDGANYQLTQAISGSGARYTSENGPTPDQLLTWWSKGEEATWSESPLDDSATPADEKIIATCKQVKA